jgi:hypothetical protein
MHQTYKSLGEHFPGNSLVEIFKPIASWLLNILFVAQPTVASAIGIAAGV